MRVNTSPNRMNDSFTSDCEDLIQLQKALAAELLKGEIAANRHGIMTLADLKKALFPSATLP